jgi:hypothetical protein
LFFTDAGPAWQLVDVHPSREAITHHLTVANPLLERTLLAFDYLIVIATVTASGNY